MGRYAVSFGVGEVAVHNEKDGQYFQYIDIGDPFPWRTDSGFGQITSPLSGVDMIIITDEGEKDREVPVFIRKKMDKILSFLVGH